MPRLHLSDVEAPVTIRRKTSQPAASSVGKPAAAGKTAVAGKPVAPAKPSGGRRSPAKPSSSPRDVASPLTPSPAISHGDAILGVGGDVAADQGADAPTERQLEIYAFIRDKIQNRGYGPTVREIGQAFDIRSPNGVVCHLKALERKGLISRGKNMSRAIELITEPAHLRGLPMAGWVAAGTLRTADEQQERIDFEELFDKDDHFVLKVMGDSMVEAQIADGDWVVIRRRHTAHAGDIVVAQTEDGEATLQQWFPERDRIRLQPANSSMKPIYVRNARVLGILVGVVRKTG
jgi:repressor LexA